MTDVTVKQSKQTTAFFGLVLTTGSVLCLLSLQCLMLKRYIWCEITLKNWQFKEYTCINTHTQGIIHVIAI